MPVVFISEVQRSPMQSGRARVKGWVLSFGAPEGYVDPLMGWTGTGDTQAELRLSFQHLEEAVDYAKGRGWAYVVQQTDASLTQTSKPQRYADNFLSSRMR